MDTPIIEAPAVEPEVSQPDANLLKQLARVQRERDNVRAVAAWLEDHHERLLGLHWHAAPGQGEIIIVGGLLGGITVTRLREIAGLFPGQWKCGVPCIFGHEHLDWVAEREGITLRIQAAEKLAPAPGRPLLATF